MTGFSSSKIPPDGTTNLISAVTSSKIHPHRNADNTNASSTLLTTNKQMDLAQNTNGLPKPTALPPRPFVSSVQADGLKSSYSTGDGPRTPQDADRKTISRDILRALGMPSSIPPASSTTGKSTGMGAYQNFKRKANVDLAGENDSARKRTFDRDMGMVSSIESTGKSFVDPVAVARVTPTFTASASATKPFTRPDIPNLAPGSLDADSIPQTQSSTKPIENTSTTAPVAQADAIVTPLPVVSPQSISGSALSPAPAPTTSPSVGSSNPTSPPPTTSITLPITEDTPNNTPSLLQRTNSAMLTSKTPQVQSTLTSIPWKRRNLPAGENSSGPSASSSKTLPKPPALINRAFVEIPPPPDWVKRWMSVDNSCNTRPLEQLGVRGSDSPGSGQTGAGARLGGSAGAN
jgi:hypothetical protein